MDAKKVNKVTRKMFNRIVLKLQKALGTTEISDELKHSLVSMLTNYIVIVSDQKKQPPQILLQEIGVLISTQLNTHFKAKQNVQER